MGCLGVKWIIHNNSEFLSQNSEFSANFWFVFANLIEKATHVTIFWNLARNPEKNSSKIRAKNARFEVFAIEVMNILFFLLFPSFSFFLFLFFFARIGRSDLTKKLEKVGPFECDELEKHCRVSAKCYPTKVPALYTMTKEKFKSVFLLLLLVSRQTKSQLLMIRNLFR